MAPRMVFWTAGKGSKRGCSNGKESCICTEPGQRAGEARQKQLDVATIVLAQLSTTLVARIATAPERSTRCSPAPFIPELGGSATGSWYGWHCGVESIQTPPSSSYFSGDKFNIA